MLEARAAVLHGPKGKSKLAFVFLKKICGYVKLLLVCFVVLKYDKLTFFLCVRFKFHLPNCSPYSEIYETISMMNIFFIYRQLMFNI